MPTPDRLNVSKLTDPDHAPADNDQDHADLAELRRDLAAIVGDLKKAVEARAAQAKTATMAGVEQGLDAARGTIRSHPVTAITVALLFGAALAIAVVPARRPTKRLSRLVDWAPTNRAEVVQMAHGLQDKITHSGTMASLASAFERVVDSVSSIDPKTSLTPALKQAGTWLNSLRTMGGKSG